MLLGRPVRERGSGEQRPRHAVPRDELAALGGGLRDSGGCSHLELLCLLAAPQLVLCVGQMFPQPLSPPISMETTITGVKYQPLEGRPRPRAGCHDNVPLPVILSPGFFCRGAVWGGGLSQLDQETPHFLTRVTACMLPFPFPQASPMSTPKNPKLTRA